MQDVHFRSLHIVFLIALICIIASSGVVMAAGAVGWVQESRGQVNIMRGGAAQPAKVGMVVNDKDRIATGPASRVQIMFKDKTILTLAADSNCDLADVFMERNQKPVFFVRLIKGTLGLLTGAIKKLNSSGFKVETPQLTLGIRGTEFASAVDSGHEVHGLYADGPLIVSASGQPAQQAAPALTPAKKRELCEQIEETVRRLDLAFMEKRGVGQHAEAKQLQAQAREYEKLLGTYQCE